MVLAILILSSLSLVALAALIVLAVQQRDVAAVRANFGNRGVVELKNVLDHLVFHAVDGSVLTAGIQHNEDVLLGNGLGVLIGVDVEQAQNAVGRLGQNPNEGRKEEGHKAQKSRHSQCHFLGVLHCDALGHQLAAHDAEEGQNDGDHEHADVVQHLSVQRNVNALQPGNQRLCKVVCCVSTSQKAGQRDGDLDGG